MIKRIPFDIGHLDLMDIRPLDRDSVVCLDSVRYVLKNLPLRSECVTIIIDGRLIACMGYWSPFDGTAEVWLIPSIYVKEYRFAFVRIVENYLKVLADTFKWSRIQTVTRTDLFHRRWMKALKFEEEGIMRKYFQGEDYIISARYFDWGNK